MAEYTPKEMKNEFWAVITGEATNKIAVDQINNGRRRAMIYTTKEEAEAARYNIYTRVERVFIKLEKERKEK